MSHELGPGRSVVLSEKVEKLCLSIQNPLLEETALPPSFGERSLSHSM